MGNTALIHINRRAGIVIVAMLLTSLGLFVAGIFRPFTSVTKLWLFENQISVFQGLVTLWRSSELFLFLILFVFTVTFPLVKITSLLLLWLRPGLPPDRVEIIPPGSIPKTSSGKLRRSEALRQERAGELNAPKAVNLLSGGGEMAKSALAHARRKLGG